MEFNVTGIAICVGMVNEAIKYVAKNVFHKDPGKLIPVLSVVFGIALGVVGYFLGDTELGDTLMECIFCGAYSGSASTCFYEIYKQNIKKNRVQAELEEFTEEMESETNTDESETVTTNEEEVSEETESVVEESEVTVDDAEGI